MGDPDTIGKLRKLVGTGMGAHFTVLSHLSSIASCMPHKKYPQLHTSPEAERQYDVEETRRLCASLEPKTLQAKGICLLNLRVTGMRTGLGGKTYALAHSE